MAMKILHIGKFYPPFAGGMENFLADLLQAQIKQGIDARALVHDHRLPWQKHPDKEDKNIQRVPCFGRLLYVPLSPQFPWYLHRAIQQFQPDILHLHLPNTSAFWVMTLACAKKIPWVIHWHSDVVASQLDARLSLGYPLYRPFEQALLKRAEIIIATSPTYLEASEALKPWHDKCHVVSLGLNTDTISQPSQSAKTWATQQWQGTGLRLLNIGRLTYYKGQLQLITALAEVNNAQLLIVGKGENKATLQQTLQTLSLQSQVKLLGYCDDEHLIALLQSCDCFCLPSLERTEAFGVVLMEAMYQQKPIIASNIKGSGVTWVVQAGKTGLLVDPFKPSHWQTAIEKMQNKNFRHQLAMMGKQRFEQQFQIQQVAQSIQDLYAIIFRS